MSTGNINKKSQLKNIRFPHELLEEIDSSVERESSNFSSWVIDACEKKLKSERRKTKSSES
ncbi:YlcI/YnfO family protein [Morganella psychrotolerans]|uniref:YlcI/YnfO family protein n=1 Tax=Morganella psychrotolerans TaxID=368603 RepID=UPI0009446DBB|nr:YlcI/YnfO family protein [Morganella psychrotolerans]